MKKLNQDLGTTFVFSTHDQKVIDFADHYIGIEDGKVRYLGLRKDGAWLIRDQRRQSGRNEAGKAIPEEGVSHGA
jgi:putative ABC transport system ATP-binding protein